MPSFNADQLNCSGSKKEMGSSSIPLKRKLGYSVGHVLNDLTASMWFSYLIAYFHEVKQFDDWLAGYLMLIGQVADAVLTPLIGIACDKSGHGCCHIGRRKSWHIIGTISIAVSFPFIFIPCYRCDNVPDWAQFLYFVPIIILFQFGWASLQISHLSLIPEMTSSSTEKVQLNGWRYAITVTSHTTVYLLALLLFDLHKEEDKKSFLNPEDAHIFRVFVVNARRKKKIRLRDQRATPLIMETKFRAPDMHVSDLAVYVVGIGIVFSGIFYFCVHEKEHAKSPSSKLKENMKTEDKSIEQNESMYELSTVSLDGWPRNKSTETQTSVDSDINQAKGRIWTLQEYGCITSSMSMGAAQLGYKEKAHENHLNDSVLDMKGQEKSRHWKQWLKRSHFYQMALIYMCTRLVVNISEIYMPMYITESLQMKKESVAIVPMTVYVAGLLTSLFMRSTNGLLGRKRTYIIGQSFILGACIWLFFIDKETSSRIYGVATLIGIGGSTVLVTSLAMTADLIDEYSDSAGFVYGAMSFLEKLANGIAVVLIQRLNPCKSTGPSSEDTCTKYYRNVIVTVPGGVTFISLLVILSLMPSIGGIQDWKYSDRHRMLKKTTKERKKSLHQKNRTPISNTNV